MTKLSFTPGHGRPQRVKALIQSRLSRSGVRRTASLFLDFIVQQPTRAVPADKRITRLAGANVGEPQAPFSKALAGFFGAVSRRVGRQRDGRRNTAGTQRHHPGNQHLVHVSLSRFARNLPHYSAHRPINALHFFGESRQGLAVPPRLTERHAHGCERSGPGPGGGRR